MKVVGTPEVRVHVIGNSYFAPTHWKFPSTRIHSPVGIEFLSSAMLHGLADPQNYEWELRIHVAMNSWMAEGRWHMLRPSQMGFVENDRTSWSEAGAGSVGNWLTERYLPMAMVENTRRGLIWFWQIEHNPAIYEHIAVAPLVAVPFSGDASLP